MTDFNSTIQNQISFSEALQNFLRVAQEKVDERFKPYAPAQCGRILFEEGPKFVRVIVQTGYHGKYDDNAGSRSAFCFVEKATGLVYKPAGWKAPERRNPRSNIFNADNGGSGITGYGTVYLR